MADPIEAVDPAAYELRRYIQESKVNTDGLSDRDKRFLANYLRIPKEQRDACPVCKGDRQIREGEIDESGTGPRFIRCPACSLPAPPSSSVDEAAVEAAMQWIPRSSDMESLIRRSSLARTITDAYAQKRVIDEAPNEAWEELHKYFRRRIEYIEARLTAERAVREKLVEEIETLRDAFDGMIDEARIPEGWEEFVMHHFSRCCDLAALAAAEKLENTE